MILPRIHQCKPTWRAAETIRKGHYYWSTSTIGDISIILNSRMESKTTNCIYSSRVVGYREWSKPINGR